MFDVSKYKEVKTMTRNGWTTRYYVDENDICHGRTCHLCRSILPVEMFNKSNTKKYGVNNRCIDCLKSYRTTKRETIVDGMPYSQYYSKKSAERYRNRTPDQITEERNRRRPEGVKICYRCRQSRDFSWFSKNVCNPDGLVNLCRTCRTKEIETYTEEYRERLREYYKTTYKNAVTRSIEEIESTRSSLHPDGTKLCSSCEEIKLLTEFPNGVKYADGLFYMCRPCWSERRSPEIDFKWESRGIPIRCYVCGTSDALHSDHVIPKSRGGSDKAHNRLPMCEFHNLSKHATPLVDWLERRHPDIKDEVLHRVTVEFGVNLSL